MTVTASPRGARKIPYRVLDFWEIKPGELVRLRTHDSDWYLTKLQGCRLGHERALVIGTEYEVVRGILVQVRGITSCSLLALSPTQVTISRYVSIGLPAMIGGKRTSSIQEVWLNNHFLG